MVVIVENHAVCLELFKGRLKLGNKAVRILFCCVLNDAATAETYTAAADEFVLLDNGVRIVDNSVPWSVGEAGLNTDSFKNFFLALSRDRLVIAYT